MSIMATTATNPQDSETPVPQAGQAPGMRVNGKNWHAPKKAFRPTAGQVSYAKRKEQEQVKQTTKAREAEMRQEKEQERDRKIQAIKDRRKAKEEKERYDKMAEKMHKKLVERRRRREKKKQAAQQLSEFGRAGAILWI